MDLLKDIKHKRAKQRQKKPIKRDAFNQISGLVRQYGLEKSFLDALDEVGDYLATKNLKFARIRLKVPVESPLFSLVTKEEYFLTMSIIKKVDCPYLRFAHSPEEVLLCKPLYRLNPSLAPEKLMRYHFETLYLHERAKVKNTET
ncbi:MAG: hypothetical protein OEV45_00295 [Desulfobacteraceae bacterium]|nr:hypothetical protein [Desulfobacteraceae bacterium]